MSVLTSRDNAKVKRWAKLANDPRYRKSEKRALIEGPHLLAAALQHGHKPVAVLATEEGAADPEISRLIRASGLRPVLLAKGTFRGLVDTETPPGVAAEIAIPEAPKKEEASRVVFLEGVQDPANVGAIMRSAAAFGVQQVILDPGCADPWSPKALRAGMGGHFLLQIGQTRDLAAAIDTFKGTVACTVPRGGGALGDSPFERSWAWIFGAEGRGLSDETIRRADLRVTIAMAAGAESLNVAAAAAICLYEAFSRSAA
ncbi:MAG TPA: RNA methyltransferase [Burkholderiales bacterium]|nr:RNA methyltransferase [Burkholderiales bacterium]